MSKLSTQGAACHWQNEGRRWAGGGASVTLISGMKASRLSLAESILVVVNVWLAAVLLGALAWNRHWKLPFGLDLPALALLVALFVLFSRRSRGNREDQ
jgi:hypothetical protein